MYLGPDSGLRVFFFFEVSHQKNSFKMNDIIVQSHNFFCKICAYIYSSQLILYSKL